MNQNFIKKNLNIILYNQDWINGIITNNKIKTFFNKNDIKFVLILKNTVKDEFLKKELSVLQIPIISFINTDQNINNINYPIIINSKNIKSLYTLIYLIRKLF